MVSSGQPTDLNENYNKSTENPGKNEFTEHAEKKLERNLSFEIKKVPLQEGPRSFDGNTLLNRGHAIKIKTVSSCVVDKTSKPQEQGSGDASTDVLQNSCVECNMKAPDAGVASSVSVEERQCPTCSDALQRPDCLPLKEKGHARWSLQGAENTQPTSASMPEDTSLVDLDHGVKNLSVVPQSLPQMDHSSSESADPHHSGMLSLRAPLCFTNPLHSDDSDTDERNSDESMTQIMSSVSTASATVSAAASTENISARKVLPMSIVRHDATIEVHSRGDKDAGAVEDLSLPLPERTPESLVLASEQTATLPRAVLLPRSAEWSLSQDQKTSEQAKCLGLKMAGPAQLDYHEMEDKSQTDRILQPPLSSPTAKRSLEPDDPVESTTIGFGNRCGKPRGPREPPSEWT